jgi:predicted XRE-type DNA-binding protein
MGRLQSGSGGETLARGANGWTQAEAASRCGVTQPRMNDLFRGRLSRFSLDALVNVAAKLGAYLPSH